MLNVWALSQLPQLLTSWRLQAKAARKAKRKAADRQAARRAEQQQLRIVEDADENAAATPPDAFGETRAVDAARRHTTQWVWQQILRRPSRATNATVKLMSRQPVQRRARQRRRERTPQPLHPRAALK